MRQYLTISLRAARRVTCVIASILISATALPLLFNSGSALAATQLQSRGIQMSDSSASGGSITSGVGSGTNVTYNVSFTTSATGPAASMVIDFCSQNPIINDTCSGPTGFNASSAVLNATATSGNVQTTTDNWAVTASNSQIELANDDTGGTLHPTHDMQASTTESFSLSGITNPSAANCSGDANCTFYARMYTYINNNYAPVTGGTAYSNATSVGTYQDYGGIALSTTNPITVQATVQEQLTFCVTSTDPTATDTGWTVPTPGPSFDGCSATDLLYPALTLGHGSPTLILDTSAVDTGNIFTDLSTNAQHGAVIDMRSSNLSCSGGNAGGLSADGGTTCAIPPVNSGSAGGPTPMTAGTAGFGMSCGPYAVAGAGTNGTLACTAEYDDGTHMPSSAGAPGGGYYYGMETAGSGAYSGLGSVVGPYGSQVASSTTPLYNAFTEYVFGATAALTTPAGIYSGDLSLIATGTF